MPTLQTPDLKGSSFPLSVLHLPNDQLKETLAFLQKKVSQAPAFFTNAPVVINISQVENAIDFGLLKDGVIDAGMIPVAIAGCNKQFEPAAREAGFAIISSTHNPNDAPVTLTPTKIIRHPIRSGQQVYAKDSDLVILNHVSAGAEVIADGSIQIYGTLRGRAIAGANGLQEASIICNDLQAELISIAGNYWLSDQIETQFWKKKTLLMMQDDTLHIEELSL